MSSFHKVLSRPQRFIVRPASGWVDLVLSETQEILSSSTQKFKFEPSASIEDGVVVVSDCDYRQGLELLLRLSSAHDVEWVVHSSRVSARAEWSEFFIKSSIQEIFSEQERSKIHISALVSHPVVGTAKEVRAWAQKALGQKVGDSLSEETEDEVSVEHPHRIRIDCTKNRARVLVSLAGAPLYRRGYKAQSGIATAPLPEHHSSNCFRWSMDQFDPQTRKEIFDGRVVVAVPFAGTGTTGFEAVNRMQHFAAGLSRKGFSCESFTFHPLATFDTIKKRLQTQILKWNVSTIFGDINDAVLSDLQDQLNAFRESTGVVIESEIVQNDFLNDPTGLLKHDHDIVAKNSIVFLPMNPPYGQRLAKRTGGDSVYERLGAAIIEFCRRASALTVCGYVVCPDEDTWLSLNQRLRGFKLATRHFTHGGNDTRLMAFSKRCAP